MKFREGDSPTETKFRFTAEMFDGCWHSSKVVTYQDVIARANALLEAEENKCERVYYSDGSLEIMGIKRNDYDTHTALLWNVEKIEENE